MTMALILMSKVVVATAIAALAELVRRRSVRPELAYALWWAAIGVLIMPSLVSVPVPSEVSSHAASLWLSGVLNSTLLNIVRLFWLLGSGLILWRHVQDLRLLDRLVRFAAPAPATISGRCSVIASDLGIRKCPIVVTAAGTFSPFLWHPVAGDARIVIPDELLEQFSDEMTDAILHHELIHLRRCDAWRRRLEVLVLTLWWWLPTTWIARRRLHELEELCTDVAVLRAKPHGAKAYARALLDTEEFLSRCNSRNYLAVSAFTSGRLLKTRIARIVAHEPKSLTRMSRLLVGAAAVILLSFGLLTAGVASSTFNDGLAQVGTGHAELESKTQKVRVQETVKVHGAVTVRESVRVRELDREFVMTRSSEANGSADLWTIRLVRISDDEIEPRLWTIDPTHDGTRAGKRVNTRELEWIFAFLELNNEIIDGDGTRHRHPGGHLF